jgi:hypothetical protein
LTAIGQVSLDDGSSTAERRAVAVAAFLGRRWRAPSAVLVLALLPTLLGFGGLRTALVGLACGLAAWLLSLDSERGDRPVVTGLFVAAFACRSLALMALTGWLAPSGGSYLGPDGQTYWSVANGMVDRSYDLSSGPIDTFGSFNVGAYYYYGGLAWSFGSQLFGLQLVNGGLSALAAPLAFSMCRGLALPHAALVGLAVALHPSLTFLSSNDLLKDPSVMAASVMVAWAATRILGGAPAARVVLYVVAAAPAYAYLRLGRFYTALFLAASVAGAALVVPLLAALRRRRSGGGERGGPGRSPGLRWRTMAVTAVGLLVLFGGVEAAVVRAGWPLAPAQFASVVTAVSGSPMMLNYSPGTVSTGVAGFVPDAITNTIRRLYGPFVWIWPNEWTAHALVAADYFLYPGMLLWYALWPFLLVGFAWVGLRVLAGAETRLGLVALWLFSAAYMAVFLTINLSHRQREDLFPFLVVFASFGVPVALRCRAWRRWYGLYWLAILSMAALHLAARSRLVS